ncbi:hypothetical protein Adt_23093 [Abeliophyllum distichum]|uniref:DUF2062 domain-containing protein n=1 Tax=Abeliophyllum distichum TaxID=126358 RepID=A0ABD1SCM7_9LAMI
MTSVPETVRIRVRTMAPEKYRRPASPNTPQGGGAEAIGIFRGFRNHLGRLPHLWGYCVSMLGWRLQCSGSFCHAPTVMLTNFMATPVELSLVVPFLRFGEFIAGGPHFPLTSDAFKKVLTGQASREVLQSIFHALLGWVIAAPFILGTLYILLLPCFKILVRKFSTVPSSPKKPLHSITEVRLKVRDV